MPLLVPDEGEVEILSNAVNKVPSADVKLCLYFIGE